MSLLKKSIRVIDSFREPYLPLLILSSYVTYVKGLISIYTSLIIISSLIIFFGIITLVKIFVLSDGITSLQSYAWVMIFVGAVLSILAVTATLIGVLDIIILSTVILALALLSIIWFIFSLFDSYGGLPSVKN